MRIGYASLTVGIPDVKFRTTRLNNATDEKLIELIAHNLRTLAKIMDYNVENNIHMFRISSDIIPFGSHTINTLEWWGIFEKELTAIGEKVVNNDIRLSMHPGQYTVLNSPDEDVVKRAKADLMYHTRFLDALKLDATHKIILHIGGVYGDKETAIARFIQNYRTLDTRIQKRLIIENDDRQYTVSDALFIGEQEGIPVVFDNLHHACNPDLSQNEMEWLLACQKTWKEEDGRQKIHYSQQDPDKRIGAHSRTIDLDEFNHFYQQLPTKELDIMFEVKDKNLSAVKGIHFIASPEMKRLEKEWSRYKYLVLEHSPKIYQAIRQLLKDKNTYPVLEFYHLIDEALDTPVSGGHAVNAAQHIWGYVSDLADEKTKKKFDQNLEKVSAGGLTRSLKRILWQLAQMKEDQYLLNSLYFSQIF